MPRIGRTFRIFVSSTFGDMQAERDALHRQVFPRLRELCTGYGCRFQAIDLRWGVSEEAALDQQTMKICLGEIERCQKVTPRPNFIVLLGDRYGWRPLPYEIAAHEFEELMRRTPGEPERQLMSRWYWRDDNAVPAEYVLQPRSGEFASYDVWEQQVERPLRLALQRAAAEMNLTAEARRKYVASATEQEVVQGALGVADAQEHVFCFLRSIGGLPKGRGAAGFVDLNADGELDLDAQERLRELKRRLRCQLAANVFDYSANWSGSAPTTEHIAELCQDVYESLARVIGQQVAQMEGEDPLEQERAAHRAFGAERAGRFAGRADALQDIQRYLHSSAAHVLAVDGPPGSGKSALLARAAAMAELDYPGAVVVTRYVGVTPDSSDPRQLLRSLCQEIMRRYGDHEPSMPAGDDWLSWGFGQKLRLASAEKPLLMFVDGLDQLADAPAGRDLGWLPDELGANVRIVISLRSDSALRFLDWKFPPSRRVTLAAMPPSEAAGLLDLWLADVRRTLQPEQRALLLARLERCGLPLYLRLAFEEVRHWRSYDGIPTAPDGRAMLGEDVPGAVRRLFQRLSSGSSHGPALLSRSLAYLACARHGLAEDEMLDLLSADEEVMSDLRRRLPRSPAMPHLPAVVWARLRWDLDPYLSERSADGTTLLSFYHRQLLEVASADYLAQDAAVARHQHIARYFARQPLRQRGESGLVYNLRLLAELPYQQMHGQMWAELETTLSDLAFVEAKCAAGMAYRLVDDYLAAERLCRLEPDRRGWSAIHGFGEWLRRQANELSRYPERTFQCAANEPEGSRPAQAAQARWAAGIETRPWFRWVNIPAGLKQRVVALNHESVVDGCSWSPDGRCLVTTTHGGLVRLWDVDSGEPLFCRRGLLNDLHLTDLDYNLYNYCALSPDGRNVAVGSRWLGVTLVNLADASGRPEPVHGLSMPAAWSPDGKRLAGWAGPRLLIWDTERREEAYARPSGHTDRAYACAWSDDGSRIAWVAEPSSGRSHGASACTEMWQWQADTGAEITRCTIPNEHVLCWSPDCRRVVSDAGIDGLRVRDAQTGELLCCVTPGRCEDPVLQATWSPDGESIAVVQAQADSLSDAAWVWTWGVASGSVTQRFPVQAGTLRACAWSPDSAFLAFGGHQLCVWGVRRDLTREDTRSEAQVEDDEPRGARYLRWSPDGKRLSSSHAHRDGRGLVRIWDGETGALLKVLSNGPQGRAIPHDWSQDGRRIVQLSLVPRDHFTFWDADSGRKLATLPSGAVQTSPASAPAGQAPPPQGDVELVRDPFVEHSFASWLRGPRGVLSPDRRFVLSGDRGTLSSEGRLWVKDVRSEHPVATLEGYKSLCAASWSPDGRLVLFRCGPSTLGLWLWRAGSERVRVLALKPPQKNYGIWLSSWCWAPDGRRIAVGAHWIPEDYVGEHPPRAFDLRIVDVRSGADGLPPQVSDVPRYPCDWSPDSRRILLEVGYAQTEVQALDAGSGEVLAAQPVGPEIEEVLPDAMGVRVAVADRAGQLLLLRLEGIEPGLPVCTPVYQWDWSKHRWAPEPSAHCPACHGAFTPPDEVVAAIMAASGRLAAQESPCLVLPDRAWEMADLVSACPLCQHPVRFTPFLVDNRDLGT